MSAKICVLASGSKGNCTFISDGTTHILIDAGISCTKIKAQLLELGYRLDEVNAVLITHEHTDHIYGLHTLTRRYSMPVLANSKTAVSVDNRLSTTINLYCKDNFDTGFRIGSIDVFPFRTSHDAVCSVGYILTVGGHRIAYVTDLGVVTPGVKQNVLGCEAVILESNHDVAMLRSGPYPPDLQARILGRLGHLSNEDSAHFQVELAKSGVKHVVLAHLSEVNNTPELALETAQAVFEAEGVPAPEWTVAKQNSAVVLEL